MHPREVELIVAGMNDIPWFLWPFEALWNLLSGIFMLTGRMVLAIVGLMLAVLGAVLTVLIVTAPVGIPLALLGGLLITRSIF